MHKKLIFIIAFMFLQHFIYAENTILGVDIVTFKNIDEEKIIKTILFCSGSYLFCTSLKYCMKENQNDKPNKNYYLPGGIAVSALALILLSPKISTWFVKK